MRLRQSRVAKSVRKSDGDDDTTNEPTQSPTLSITNMPTPTTVAPTPSSVTNFPTPSSYSQQPTPSMSSEPTPSFSSEPTPSISSNEPTMSPQLDDAIDDIVNDDSLSFEPTPAPIEFTHAPSPTTYTDDKLPPFLQPTVPIPDTDDRLPPSITIATSCPTSSDRTHPPTPTIFNPTYNSKTFSPTPRFADITEFPTPTSNDDKTTTTAPTINLRETLAPTTTDEWLSSAPTVWSSPTWAPSEAVVVTPDSNDSATGWSRADSLGLVMFIVISLCFVLSFIRFFFIPPKAAPRAIPAGMTKQYYVPKSDMSVDQVTADSEDLPLLQSYGYGAFDANISRGSPTGKTAASRQSVSGTASASATGELPAESVSVSATRMPRSSSSKATSKSGGGGDKDLDREKATRAFRRHSGVSTDDDEFLEAMTGDHREAL